MTGFIFSKSFEKALYSYEEFCSIDAETVGKCCIKGSDVPKEIKASMNLIPDCGYIFRKTLRGGFVPRRVTMHPKTAYNYERGSKLYGFESIIGGVFR